VPNAGQLGVPRQLRAQTTVTSKSSMRLVVDSEDERQAAIQALVSAGWVQSSTSAAKTQMHRPKKLRGADVAIMAYGFFCFIIPAVIYFIMWTNKPIPTITIELRQ
jgi:hypothetical protein